MFNVHDYVSLSVSLACFGGVFCQFRYVCLFKSPYLYFNVFYSTVHYIGQENKNHNFRYRIHLLDNLDNLKRGKQYGIQDTCQDAKFSLDCNVFFSMICVVPM
uniref:Uncharacterized protein n=1 Tax=Cacopsylla melanoneura TaxID=428564 RepID=A0A8D8LJ36_9HEMI